MASIVLEKEETTLGTMGRDLLELEQPLRNPTAMETVPVILDTDIGSDIDDAVALAYLLRQPRCELVGVTTVTGEPDKRAMLTSAICRAAGRPDVPIHVGTEEPLLILPRQKAVQQAEALTEEWPHREYSKRNTAIEFLRNTIRARPGEITLLAIGPLTNVALLFAIDPEIPMLLKQLVLMGGRYTTRGHDGALLEWNILCDPHAAARVFATPLPRLVAVGLDVTLQCRMDADECRRRFTAIGGPLAPTAAMAEVWFRHTEAITFHDPLAAALIFQPDLCLTEDVHIKVELNNPHLLGLTYPRHDLEARPHEIAVTVDPAAFFAHYYAVVGRE
jgi:purine nucleosidase